MHRRIVLVVLLCCIFIPIFATHERAGEITYRHISGLTYEITLTTYTYAPSPADRPNLDIDWGDGSSSNVFRYDFQIVGTDIKKNVYIASHTYPSAGTYIISMVDENRNQGIVNIPQSVSVPFYIETEITINNFFTPNNSPILNNPPIDVGCVGVPFYHNPVAIDPDGDSLSYSLIACRRGKGQFIAGYTTPLASNSISIDARTGDFVWDSPMLQGEYNIAILIEEWRKGIKIGSVVRDMQINITACNNLPPIIQTISYACVNAGDSLTFLVEATDDSTQIVTLSALGDVFSVNQPASFSKQSNYGHVGEQFVWATDCKHVRLNPYQVTFKAQDNGNPINLVSLHTLQIQVVAPAPQQLQTLPSENSIFLSWQPSPCSSLAKGYKIYRKIDPSGFVPMHCQTGVPQFTGFQQIAITTDTFFIDDNASKGLLHGMEYCYMVIAYFSDGAESYASNESCTILKQSIPIITHISIDSTDENYGKIAIQWEKPKEIDTIQYQGPYSFELFCSNNNTSNFILVDTFLYNEPTIYQNNNKNTTQNQFYYQLRMYNLTNGKTLIGSSDIGSSIFLQIHAGDRKNLLSWHSVTPWNNIQYEIQRYNTNNQNFDIIATTTDTFYYDTSLINGENYCYRILAFGQYSDTTIQRPLQNYSQIVCAIPIDNQAPDCPILQGQTDCENIDLQWDINLLTNKDILQFYIYYRPDVNSQFSIIDSVPYTEMNYQIIHPISVIGCFIVTAIDSNGNESEICSEICFDNDICPQYKLPNIFTPDALCEGIPCLFRPYKYNFVESAEIFIYNRWGNLVFFTTNPDINWDGINQQTKQKCVAGVYYYFCNINEYTLKGISKRIITGSITLIR